MDINNVSTFITLDPSKLFNAEGLYQRAMVMYEGDEDLIESFLKEHLASDSLAYAMHLLEETSSTSYMGVKIHYNGTSFSAPTAGVYGVKSRPEIKARIKAKVLKRNDQQNKAAALRKEDVEVVEGYKGTADLSKADPAAKKKVEDRIAKHFGTKRVPGGKMGVKEATEEVEVVDEGKGKKAPRWQDDDCDGKWYEKGDTDGKISKREKKAKAKQYSEKYDNTKSPDYEKKKKALAKKHGGEDKIKGHPQYEEVEVVDEMNTELSSIKQKFKGKMTKSSVVKRLKDRGESKREFRNSYKKDIDGGYVGPHKPTKSNLKTALKKQNEEVEVSNVPEGGCTTRKDQLVNIGEEGYDRMRDDRLVKYGIGHDGSDRKPSQPAPKSKVKGKTVLQRETEKKYGKGKSALDIVKAKITAKHGKGAIMSKESIEEASTAPKEDSKVKRQNMLKRQVLMKKLQAVRAGGGADVVASYQPEGELVTDEYTVTNADKKGNTKAWQNYKNKVKNVKTGKPLYKAADHVKEESDLDTKFSEIVSENSSLEPQAKAIDVADKNTSVKGKKKGNVLINPEVKTNVDESMETQKDNLQEVDLNTRSVDYGQEIKNAEPIKKKKPLKDFKKLAGAAAKNKKLG